MQRLKNKKLREKILTEFIGAIKNSIVLKIHLA